MGLYLISTGSSNLIESKKLISNAKYQNRVTSILFQTTRCVVKRSYDNINTDNLILWQLWLHNSTFINTYYFGWLQSLYSQKKFLNSNCCSNSAPFFAFPIFFIIIIFNNNRDRIINGFVPMRVISYSECQWRWQ